MSQERASNEAFGIERTKAFIDAVVAIAMTLLILPLMDSVGEATEADGGAASWIVDNVDELISFVLSFVIIALFWIGHHRLFTQVERVTANLLWLTVAWLLSIVWLPVATAISSQMSAEDGAAKAVYIGSMIATCLLSVVIMLYLYAHPGLHAMTPADLRAGMAAQLATATLFAIALAVTLAFPALGYLPLLVMFATGPAQVLYGRMLRVRR